MTVPSSQFHLFWIDGFHFLYQTYEEALVEACRICKSAEFVDLDPDSILDVTLFFPKNGRKITICSGLFTYSSALPLVTGPRYDEQKTYEFKNLGV